MSGKTVVDPTFVNWGCGIGLELNDGTQAYDGPATCFDYALAGDSGGNEVRLALTQVTAGTGAIAPYVTIPAFSAGHSGTLCLKDVSCNTQPECSSTRTTGCCTPIAGNGTPYALQIQLPGGYRAGNFFVCLTSLVPKTG
ncbi:MAG TPA: hypothetical protein VGM29_00325 [Polyangiaceae bacterium]|jgi:hypothetical protein